MLLCECFWKREYVVISLDDVYTFDGVNRIPFMPFYSFRDAVYYCRHLARRSIYYCAHDPFSNELFESPCLHYVIAKCSSNGISLKNFYNIYFDLHGGFYTVLLNYG